MSNTTSLAVKCSLLAAFPLLTLHFFHYRRPRIIKLASFWDSLVWSVRASLFSYPFPRNMDHWDPSKTPSQQIDATWEFLRPFFALKGYILYKQYLNYAESFPCSAPSVAPASLRRYPYARTLPTDTKFGMIMGSSFVWGARDELDRDVVIKLISEAGNPSNEWLILQKFNRPDMRDDGRNCTICVIEYITFANFVFAVMPRWDNTFLPRFSTVGELMEVSKAYLEGMVFLHDHRIAHQDFSLGNSGMNLYGDHSCLTEATGVRDPNEVQYIVYDFGYSLIYPMDTNINEVQTSRRLQYSHAPDPEGPYNPFKSDVAMMGGLLHGHVMHASKTVPEIEPFFDRMMDLDEQKRPTAVEALREFMQIYNALTKEQLHSPVDCKWTNRFRSKFELLS